MRISGNMLSNNAYFKGKFKTIQSNYKNSNMNFELTSIKNNQSNNLSCNNSVESHKVYIKSKDMLYSGGNETGLSFYIKYAENSNEDSPVMIAKGIDENGTEFEKTIYIDEIDPNNATIVEMRALEAHLNVNKNVGLSSLPVSMSNMGLNERGNFIEGFRNAINEQNALGPMGNAGIYLENMLEYQAFIWGKAGQAFL